MPGMEDRPLTAQAVESLRKVVAYLDEHAEALVGDLDDGTYTALDDGLEITATIKPGRFGISTVRVEMTRYVV
ncbi:MAG: hypothetical protein IJH87_04070 [Atopobiaceae bacterium]|nr:hypothetical protein [Atopobiaceae bacterium]